MHARLVFLRPPRARIIEQNTLCCPKEQRRGSKQTANAEKKFWLSFIRSFVAASSNATAAKNWRKNSSFPSRSPLWLWSWCVSKSNTAKKRHQQNAKLRVVVECIKKARRIYKKCMLWWSVESEVRGKNLFDLNNLRSEAVVNLNAIYIHCWLPLASFVYFSFLAKFLFFHSIIIERRHCCPESICATFKTFAHACMQVVRWYTTERIEWRNITPSNPLKSE